MTSSRHPQVMRPNQDRRYWLMHGFYRTYEIAARLQAIARAPMNHARELEALTVDEGILSFVPNWQKESALHRFAAWVADDMFIDDTDGPYVSIYVEGCSEPMSRRLPVEVALEAYGLPCDSPYEIPPYHDEHVVDSRGIRTSSDSARLVDAAYEYFMVSVRPSEPYQDLLGRIADEVFHTMFHNRLALAGLNEYLSWCVAGLDPEGLSASIGPSDPQTIAEYARMAAQFRGPGRLKRVAPPRWVRRAVFFRDHGRCAWCGTDLTGLVDALPAKQFDHIVPLAAGGLNDVTNLQLLCQPCNGNKADHAVRPSSRYRRLYDL